MLNSRTSLHREHLITTTFIPVAMKVCIVSKDIVHQPISGDSVHIYNLGLHLSKYMDVALIGHCGMIRETKEYVINEHFKIIEIPDFPLLIGGALGFFLLKQPLLDYLVGRFSPYNQNLKKVFIRESTNADIVVFESCWYASLYRYIQKPDEKIIVYDARNVEYLLKEKAYNKFFKKVVLPYVKALEEKLTKNANVVFSVSEEEKSMLGKLYGVPPEKIVVCPPAIFLPAEIKRENVKRGSAVFIGSAYFANFEAVNFIINVLAEKLPDVEFRIVGTVCSKFKTKKKNVVLYGFVSEEKKKEILMTSQIGINPIFHGAGVNVKVLEYLAYGLPVVTTPVGIRGLEKIEDAVYISQPENFHEAIKHLMEDVDLQKKLSATGRSYVANHRSWESVEKIWLETISHMRN
jgi:glycosyltransferase involved in cell wall biosynthesis